MMEMRIVFGSARWLASSQQTQSVTEKGVSMCAEPLHGHLAQTTTLQMRKKDPRGKAICTP